MILTNHNDGSCYKLTIEYTDFEDSDPFEKLIRWCEDFDELLKFGLEVKKQQETLGRAVIDFRIQDDSK